MGGWEEGGVGGEGKRAARGRLNPPLSLFVREVVVSPRSANHRPNTFRGPKRCLTTTGVNFKPMHMLLCNALHGSYCLSHEFTWSEELALEMHAQTSQPSLVMAL